MYLVSRIIQNFIESINEEEFFQMEAMDDQEALEHICSIYENTYGAKPSGVAMFLLKAKFKLSNVELARVA